MLDGVFLAIDEAQNEQLTYIECFRALDAIFSPIITKTDAARRAFGAADEKKTK